MPPSHCGSGAIKVSTLDSPVPSDTAFTDDEDTAYAHGAGWHAGFEVVEAQLAGRPVDWSPWDRADELAEHYRNPAS